MALTSHDTLLIKSDEDAAFLIHSSYMTNSKLANYLQHNAGITHSSTGLMRARRNICGAVQAVAPDSYAAPSCTGASRPPSCRHAEKPEPGRVWGYQFSKRLISDEVEETPRQIRSDIVMPSFTQRCDTGRLLVCTWVLTSPEPVSLGTLNPLFGSGAPAALQSSLLSPGTSSCNPSITDVGNEETSSQRLLVFIYFSKQEFLTGTHPGSKNFHREVSRSKG